MLKSLEENQSRETGDEKPRVVTWRRNPTKTAWCSMISRCTDPNDVSYRFYQARGITVCERWREYYNFLTDMGERPDGTTLDRIDNDKGYYKENCRWATRKEQSRNMRSNRMITHNGETKCLAQWADDLGISHTNLRSRLHAGWSFERAITEPVKKAKKELK